MRKKYVSPLFAELELEDVLFSSDENSENTADDEWNDGDFDGEEDFVF